MTRSAPAVRIFTCEQFLDTASSGAIGYLCDPLIPASGVVEVGGAPYAGKTLVMLGLTASWSAGHDNFAGFKLTPGGRDPILFLALEHSDQTVAKQIRAAAAGVGLEPGDMILTIVRPPLRLGGDELAEWTRSQAESIGAPLVVVDSLRRFGQHN